MIGDAAFIQVPWPEDDVPANCPVTLYYEISRDRDAVLRSIEVFADGRIARNSIEIEERNGGKCPSLIDTGLAVGFDGIDYGAISEGAFQEIWNKGVDTPFWNPS